MTRQSPRRYRANACCRAARRSGISYATNLLTEGAGILDVVHEAAFVDQAHLTRSLRHFIGQTPARISRGDEQLSFLYKTTPRETAYDGLAP